jgi:hypothetical protein
MRGRMRRFSALVRSTCASMLRALAAVVAENVDELALFGALAVLVAGVWPLLEYFHLPGRAALAIAGVVLVWVFLPQRERFVRPRPTIVRAGRRKDAS